ncbi:Uncharacterised protein [Mycobacterium tuberculosis]|nr:Uncharacterised protein [Mycobacterium tuberculosis]CNK40623.1 Uncharacterised protein [Mycobacterium tuberculosis]
MEELPPIAVSPTSVFEVSTTPVAPAACRLSKRTFEPQGAVPSASAQSMRAHLPFSAAASSSVNASQA